MPNWCYQTLSIHGEPKQLNKLLKKIEVTKTEEDSHSEATPFSFQNVIPMPSHLLYDKKQGWHEWRIANWGTKWQPDIDVADISGWEHGSIGFQFNTAWSPPTPIIEALVKEFKKLEFHWTYWEESYEYWGVHDFKNGKEVSYEGGAFKHCEDYNRFGLTHHWCLQCNEVFEECEGEQTPELCESCEVLSKEVTEEEQQLWDTTTEGAVTNGTQALSN